MSESNITIFSGSSSQSIARSIAAYLNLSLGKAVVDRFSDGEVQVEIIDSVRGKDVFLVQSTGQDVNENLMELLLMVDALKRSSAQRVTAVVPYLGYSRQDRRLRSLRTPISAKVVAKIIAEVGTSRMLTVDLHSDQIQGFYDIPIDNVYASPVLLGDIWKQGYQDLIVISPDVGGVVRARALAKQLDDAELAIIDKRRPRAGVAEVMNIIGEVEDRTCVILDDMVDTAGTLCNAAKALKDNGARKVVAYITHPVLSGPALDNINHSELDELVVTDTLPLSEEAGRCGRIRQLSIAELLAETIRRISIEDSISSLYMD